MIHKFAFANRPLSVSRRAMLMSCASAAIAVASILPQSAHAQAFRGTITSSTGGVTRSFPATTSNSETIVIGSNTATINWSPTDQQGVGTIDFMPTGSTATFTSSQGVTDYTVLNRILPTTGQAVSLNGHVVSTLQGTSATGGKVWFYSPGGIVIGASAVFDVGGLLLTTNDVTSFSNSSTGFNATLAAPAGSTSKIQINNGAQINALPQGSYVALVAPRIEQGGKVRVNGQAAYAAAEQLTMSVNQGLFNIAVDVGTSDVNGIVHTGETSGPANVAASDNHKIFMVAVPKNQALTMLLSGKIGFDDATSASVKNGQIWLSAGNGVQDRTQGPRRIGPNGLNASMDIGPGVYTSDLVALSQSHTDMIADTGDITLTGNLSMDGVLGVGDIHTLVMATNGYHLSIAGNTFQGGLSTGRADMIATSGGVITIGGTAHLDPSDVYRSANANVLADGGTINVGGRLEINANSFGDYTFPSGPDATGGQISVRAINNGQIHSGTMALDAVGTGSAAGQTGSAGAGQGGSITVEVSNGSVLDVNGDLLINANGVGGNSALGAAGAGYGGQGAVYVYDALLDVSGNIAVQANGTGGSGLPGGLGAGGGAYLSVASGNTSSSTPGSLTAGGAVSLQASGVGGQGVDNAQGAGGVGGDAYSGYASFDAYDYTADAVTGTVSAASMEILSNATGGNGGNGVSGGAGGTAYGYGYYGDCGECGYYGSAEFSVDGVATTLGDLLLNASSAGGNGGAVSSGIGGNGGDAYGGYALLDVGPGLSVPRVTASARAVGGNGGSGTTAGNGGYAEGGSASFYLFNEGSLTANIDFSTSAVGGNGDTGGGAYGGDSWLSVDGSLTATTLTVEANGTGGAGVIQGGYGDGGDAYLDVTGTANIATSNLSANGAGGNASNGIGGDSYGGEAGIDAWGGGRVQGGNLTMSANATAGTGTTVGYASGGDISLEVSNYDAEQSPASLAFDAITLNANTTGASDGEAYAYGGEITIEASGGTISANTLVANANGSSEGGEIEFNTWTDYAEGSSSRLQLGSVTASANGGQYGGSIDFDASGGRITADSVVASANGGIDGGFISFQATNDYYGGSPGQLQFGSVNATANGGQYGGYIYAVTDSGATIDFGDAQLRANGDSLGTIWLLAGCCGDTGGEDNLALQSGSLPAGGGIAASNLTLETSGDILLGLSSGADISVSGTFKADAGNSISIFNDGTGGAIHAHALDFAARSIDSNALLAGDIIRLEGSEYLNVADVNATQSATFLTDGAATFYGTVSSPTITVTSNSLNILDGASLGVFGTTNLITLNALTNGQPIVIGEGGEGAQYLLADGDIETSAIVINAIGGGDFHIFDVQIDGSQTAGGGVRSVTLNTQGSALVNGVIDYRNAGANDSLTINAGDLIAINTDSGGIQITNPAGALTGTLTLAADNIWVASGSLLNQLSANPNFEGRAAALAANSGTANQDGFVRAGAVRAAVADSMFVQNSGTPELFAGIDTGAGGLTIEGTGNSPATVVAFGRQTKADGTVLTNQDFIGSVETEGTIGFTDDSAVNGCSIGGSCGGGDNGGDDPELGVDMATILGPLDQATENNGDTNDDDDDEGDDSEDGSKADPSMRLINTTPINLDQQIDDPVTSGGDVVVGNP